MGRFVSSALVACATLSSIACAPALARRRPKNRYPPVELVAINTHETFHLRPDPHGHFGKRQLRGWNHFLRCHHTGRVHHMATHLADLLYATARHFDHEILVVAGYRAPKIAREKGNPKSPHKKGVACDFRVDGVPNTELRDFLRASFHRIGVGYYPNSGFVHLDVGRKHDAFWIDYSGPGQRAVYSKHPEADLKEEHAAQDGGAEPQDSASQGASAPNAAALVPPSTRNN